MVRNIVDIAMALKSAGKTTLLNADGYRTRRHGFDRLVTAFDMIGVSLDGPTASAYAGMRGRGIDFDLAFELAQRVFACGRSRLKIGTVVRRVNVRLRELAALIRPLQPAVWRLCICVARGPLNSGYERHAIDGAMFRNATDELLTENADLPIAIADGASINGCSL